LDPAQLRWLPGNARPDRRGARPCRSCSHDEGPARLAQPAAGWPQV